MREAYLKLRAEIRRMPTREATAMIKAFRLPDEEEASVILCDVRKMSRVQAGAIIGLSSDAVKNRRAAAYARMCAEIENMWKNAGS